MDIKQGIITIPTSTGNQTISSLGFTPKVVLFFTPGATADTDNASYVRSSYGFTDGTNQRCSSFSGNESVSPSQISGGDSNACVIRIFDASSTPTVEDEAEIVSFASGQFTINWLTVFGNSRKVAYLALGGADLTNAKVGTFTTPGSTGDQAITGVGFQPDCIMLLTTLLTDQTLPIKQKGGAGINLGWATSTAQFQYSGFSYDNENPTTTREFYSTDKIIVKHDTAVSDSASLSSFDSDGFTINWGSLGSSGRQMFYLAMKGGSYKIGTTNEKGSTGNQAITGVGFQPKGLILHGDIDPADTSPRANHILITGAADASLNQAVMWHNSGTAQSGTSRERHSWNDGRIYQSGIFFFSPLAEATLSSMDADGFTLNFGYIGSGDTNRKIQYVAFGDAVASTSDIDKVASVSLSGINIISSIGIANISTIGGVSN